MGDPRSRFPPFSGEGIKEEKGVIPRYEGGDFGGGDFFQRGDSLGRNLQGTPSRGWEDLNPAPTHDSFPSGDPPLLPA